MNAINTLEAQRVLVVEDNSALANVVKFNLEKFGYDVTIAVNGRHAWDILTCDVGGFELIIADHQMPELSGLELCERLRGDDRFRELPFILLTAKRLELNLHELRDRLNITRSFSKPFSPAAIVDAVRDQLAAVH
jgi:CheY-like chemotaxis protein